MRVILQDNPEQQVQGDKNGEEYVYRKDYLGGGDMKEQYSLALMYSRKGKVPFSYADAGAVAQSERILDREEQPHGEAEAGPVGPGPANELPVQP